MAVESCPGCGAAVLWVTGQGVREAANPRRPHDCAELAEALRVMAEHECLRCGGVVYYRSVSGERYGDPSGESPHECQPRAAAAEAGSGNGAHSHATGQETAPGSGAGADVVRPSVGPPGANLGQPLPDRRGERAAVPAEAPAPRKSGRWLLEP